MSRRPSLFAQAALTIAGGLLVFQLVAGLAIFFNLVLPLAYRSADDLADLLVLAARVWVEMPPEQRPVFEAELRTEHRLRLLEAPAPLAADSQSYPYAAFLRQALSAHVGAGPSVRVSEIGHEHFQVEFFREGHRLRFEFSKTKVVPRPSLALAWIVAAGLLATFVLAWLLARRVTAPVARFAEAARLIGKGDRLAPLPETGEAEFADLARIFNATAGQLQARRENQTTLLAGVSHDLRSPLGRMKMALGLLGEEVSSPLVARLERDVMEMDRLIGAQLELARAREREPPETTDIDAVLAEAISAAEAQAPERSLRLSVRGSTCVEQIAPVSLRRSVDNLLANASRYGGEGRIDVVRRRLRGMIFIGVRDRGPGIPPELAETVFRPFYRIESSRSRTTGGSGLGLAITRQLAETQGWRVGFKARRRGGVSAWLMIPPSELKDPKASEGLYRSSASKRVAGGPPRN
ncbi:MAG: ATP-binding protein [Methylotetracoccus sp.]|nr:ATP-binding protein [Methylotetracoccus sp.]